jgi:hypothetical protein
VPIDVFTEGVVLIETEDRHEYTLDGKRVSGLTSIIQRAGISNYDNVPEAVMKAKSALGSKIHEYTHWWDEDDLDLDSLSPYPQYHRRVIGWTQFRSDWGFKPQLRETPMVVKINGQMYGMKPDCFGVGNFGVGGAPIDSTVEIKNTVEIEPSAQIQTAGQALALKSEDNPLPGRIVCQLLDHPNQAGKFYNIVKFEESMDERIFLCALALDTWKINMKIIK